MNYLVKIKNKLKEKLHLKKQEQNNIQEDSEKETKPSEVLTQRNTYNDQIEKKANNQREEKSMIQEETKKREMNYFREIITYLTAKKREIYVEMQNKNYKIQKNGIEQWDKIENLIEKVNKNRDNKEYLNVLHEKIAILKEKEKAKERE